MWYPEEKDFQEIEKWGLEENPFAARDDFSEIKKELRWLNPDHRKLYLEYFVERTDFVNQKNFGEHYEKVRKPLDPTRWEYLMKRKAWFIMPLGWDHMTTGSCQIADFGCGDGDTIQRLVQWVDKKWSENGVADRKVNIFGIDFNESRLENAKNLISNSKSNISIHFEKGDIIGKGLAYDDNHFDFGMITGVLEILEDEPCEKFIKEVCRVTRKGMFVEDLLEKFPGEYPREDLSEIFLKHGFQTKQKHLVFSEPFDLDRTRDPMKLWPVMLDQNLWLEKN